MREIRIIIHAGMPKTATTSIQRSLFDNYAVLLEEGILYPKTHNHMDYEDDTIINHCEYIENVINPVPSYFRAARKYTKEDSKKLVANTTDKIAQLIKPHSVNTVILSSEFLYLKQAKDIKKLKKYLEKSLDCPISFDVIIYLRSILAWMDSATQQLIKAASVIDVGMVKAVNGKSSLYRKPLKKFEKLFGKSNVRVHEFDNIVRNKKDIVESFYEDLEDLTGQQISNNIAKVKVENERVSVEAVSLINFINRSFPLYVGTEFNWAGGRRLSDIAAFSQYGNTRFLLSETKRQEILQSHAKDLKWLKEKYGVENTESVGNTEQYVDPDTISLTEENIKQLSDIAQTLTPELKKMLLAYLEFMLQKPHEADITRRIKALIADLKTK